MKTNLRKCPVRSLFCFLLINIRFQKACIKYGVADVDLFQTTDLWDLKNIALVTQTIFAVARAVSGNMELVNNGFDWFFIQIISTRINENKAWKPK